MYLPEPAHLLRQVSARLRPGAVVSFVESDLRSPPMTFPPLPVHEELARWMTPPPNAPGPEAAMGPKLFATFLRAGLPAPELRLGAPIGGGPSWQGYAYVAASVRSLLPFMEQIGVVEPGVIDVETLEERLRAEVVDHGAVQQLPTVIGAWSRTTA